MIHHTNKAIISILQDHTGEWMTCDQIVSMMRFGQIRGIGRRIRYLMDNCPNIEYKVEDTTNQRYYRFIEDEANGA